MNINKKRLSDVVRALREATEEEASLFDTRFYTDVEGNPLCPFGFYVARPDLQDRFEISTDYKDEWTITLGTVDTEVTFEHMAIYFDLTLPQTVEIFGKKGCRKAKTAAEAAVYIESFIARNGLPLE